MIRHNPRRRMVMCKVSNQLIDYINLADDLGGGSACSRKGIEKD